MKSTKALREVAWVKYAQSDLRHATERPNLRDAFDAGWAAAMATVPQAPEEPK